MLSHIKDFIGDKCRITTEAINVDEEKQLIAFESCDLAEIIRDVIRTCADCCISTTDREAVLDLLN